MITVLFVGANGKSNGFLFYSNFIVKMPTNNEIRVRVNNSTSNFAPNSATTVSLVSVRNNQAVTTSLQVAEYFGKPHKDVLNAIRRIECEYPDLQGRNFSPSFYISELHNGGRKERPMYYLTRDGFTLLAMGFTGKKALQFKIAYIEAFNKMEQMLMEGKGTEYANELLKAQIESFNKKMQRLLKNNTRYRAAGEVSCGVYVRGNGNFIDTVNNLFACLNNAYIDAYFFIGRMLEQEKELDELKKYMRSLSEDLRRKTLL